MTLPSSFVSYYLKLYIMGGTDRELNVVYEHTRCSQEDFKIFEAHMQEERYLKVGLRNNFSTGDTEKGINQNFVYVLISGNNKNKLEEEKSDSDVSVL